MPQSATPAKDDYSRTVNAPRKPQPHVVVIGGYLTEPINYRRFRERLLERGARHVSQAPIHLPDWALLGLVGMGPLLLRGGRAIREARRGSDQPVMVIGHSLGGLVARLAMAPEPFDDRVARVADDVGCLVTLGTPHRFAPAIPWRHPGMVAAEHLERVSPGTWNMPRTRYLTVGSTLTRPATQAPIRSVVQLTNRILFGFVGDVPGGRGDGLVGDAMCRLDGAPHLSYPDVRHGTLGAPWYGDAAILDRWWPVALASWRDAVAERASD